MFNWLRRFAEGLIEEPEKGDDSDEKGIIKKYYPDRGFGFIEYSGGDIYFKGSG
ncbi:MAG: hypothetical protein ACOX3R_11705 [Desulfitobacteriia bacterium]